MLKHPYIDQTVNYVLNVLNAVQDRSISKRIDGAIETGVWCCALVKSIAEAWPDEQLAPLVTLLLTLPKLSSPLLTAQSFNVLSALLKAPKYVPSSTHLEVMLQALLDFPPPTTAQGIPEAYLDVIENTMVAYARVDPSACSLRLATVWAGVREYLKVDSVAVRIAAERALGAMARYCVSAEDVERAVDAALEGDTELGETVLGKVIGLVESSIDSLLFAQAMPHVLFVLARLVSRLRQRTSLASSFEARPITAAEVLLADLVRFVGELRASKGFEYRERADEVLGVAIEVLGPASFLDILPLNLIPENEFAEQEEGRAWLLPILSQHITNTSLQHFVDYFVPMSERLFELKTAAEENDKPVEGKIWEACVEQAFTPKFAQMLTNVLYSQPTLRSPILNGLRALLQTTKSLAKGTTPAEQMVSTFGITPEQASKSLSLLKRMAGEMLAALFNLYSSMPTDSRSMVGDVISDWLSVAEPAEILTTYTKVLTLLKDNLPKASKSPTALSHSHTMLDLLVITVPYLAPNTAKELFQCALGADSGLMESKDPAVQKKTYRLLASLVQSGNVVVAQETLGVESVLKRFEETAGGALSGSKKDRLHFLHELLSYLSSTHLAHIPTVLPEVILGTKEFNEKARSEAFDCLVVIGQKLQEGAKKVSSGSDGMDEDTPQAQAAMEEYLKMTAAGMAGASPHMISSSITAVTRILFEFKDSISTKMQSDVTSAMIAFIASTNREIVKAALGYVRVAVVGLANATVQPYLGELVPALLGWTHDKKNPFKTTVLRVLSLMVKKYGYDEVCAGAAKDENAGVLVYVRKRMERARKRRAQRARRAEEEEDSDEPRPKVSIGNAFEDVLYGTDSDDTSDEEGQKQPTQKAKPAKAKTAQREPRLRIDDDDPLDLVHGMTSHVTTVAPTRRRKPGQDAAHFQVEDDTGKIVIEDEQTKLQPTLEEPAAGENLDGQAYMENLISVDGQSRTATGVVKFHKNTKKRRAMELEESQDVDMDDATPVVDSKKARKPQVVRLGREFRAKKAGGDVKRPGQQDPFAYLTLREMAGKRKGQKVKYSITGRK
ncbi:hypothetical protein FRB99_007332 [Tulasnella sp. 403]|nr:hypothetical protein FRB99_007332 [Tulasnella sp. 403]